MVVVECVAGWGGGREKGGVGVGCAGGGGREVKGGSVMQDLFCLSHISRIWSVVVCLDVVRHFQRTRKVF